MREETRIVFDIDGTVCTNSNGEYGLAQPYVDMIKYINQLYDDGWYIIFSSARGGTTCGGDIEKINEKWFHFTQGQLDAWGLKYHELHLGKIHAHVYVDDKGFRVNEDGSSVDELKKFLED